MSKTTDELTEIRKYCDGLARLADTYGMPIPAGDLAQQLARLAAVVEQQGADIAALREEVASLRRNPVADLADEQRRAWMPAVFGPPMPQPLFTPEPPPPDRHGNVPPKA